MAVPFDLIALKLTKKNKDHLIEFDESGIVEGGIYENAKGEKRRCLMFTFPNGWPRSRHHDDEDFSTIHIFCKDMGTGKEWTTDSVEFLKWLDGAMKVVEEEPVKDGMSNWVEGQKEKIASGGKKTANFDELESDWTKKKGKANWKKPINTKKS